MGSAPTSDRFLNPGVNRSAIRPLPAMAGRSCVAGARGRGLQPHQPPRKRTSWVEVGVTTSVYGEVQDHQDFTGRLDADSTVEIRARVTGYIEIAPFEEGDLVRGPSGDYPGDLLFRIDSKTYKADLAQAEANLKTAIAESTLQNLNAIRARSMVLSRSIGKEEFDQVMGARDKAKATVLSMEAARDRAQVYVGYTDVRAP